MDVKTIDRKEERRLLQMWFDTTQFDVESDGIPPVADDEEDEDDERKDAPFTVETKVIRRVRTPAGERRYRQPIGSIIVRDGLLFNIELAEPQYDGWERVRDKHTGEHYQIGQDDDGKWIVTTDNDWTPVITADNEQDAYLILEDHLTPEGQPKPSTLRSNERSQELSTNVREEIADQLAENGNTISDHYDETEARDILWNHQTGSDPLETRTNIRRWLRDNPNADPEVREIMEEQDRYLTRRAKLPRKTSLDEDQTAVGENTARRQAEADTPRRVKYNEVGEGDWVSVDGGPWFRAQRIGTQSARSRVFHGRDQNGKVQSAYRVGPRSEVMTAANPPAQVSQPETQTAASGTSPTEAAGRLANTMDRRQEANNQFGNLTQVDSDYDDWDMFRGADGNTYYVGQQGRSWVATDPDSVILAQGRDRDAVMAELNGRAGTGQVLNRLGRGRRDYDGETTAQRAGGALQGMRDAIGAVRGDDVDAASRALEPLNGTQLRQVASQLGITVGGRDNAERMRATIIQFGMRTRLNSRAISGTGNPNSPEARDTESVVNQPPTMVLNGTTYTAQELLDYAQNDPVSFLNDWMDYKYPPSNAGGRYTRREAIHRARFESVIRRLRSGEFNNETAARDLREWGRLQIAMEGRLYMTAADILDGTARPRNTRAHRQEDLEVKSRVTAFIDSKAIRRVRTDEGRRRYGQPIGSIIVRDGADPLRNLRVGAQNNRVSDMRGNSYTIRRRGGQWEATNDSDPNSPVASADNEADLLEDLDSYAARQPRRTNVGGGGPDPNQGQQGQGGQDGDGRPPQAPPVGPVMPDSPQARMQIEEQLRNATPQQLQNAVRQGGGNPDGLTGKDLFAAALQVMFFVMLGVPLPASFFKGVALWDLETKADEDYQHTGAMIALVPSSGDLHRLVDEDGEDLDELHLTLQFLGKAADISENAKLKLTRAAGFLANNINVVDVKTFSVNIFNPSGEEPCVVLGVGGEQLRAIYDAMSGMVREVEDTEPGFTVPDQHQPFVPHVTLRYFRDDPIDMAWVQKQFDKLGPIRFDKVRVAFAGNHIDMPLVGKDTMGDVPSEYKMPVITPGGRRGNDASHNRSPRENWVDKRGGLPRYIRIVRNGLVREGHSESRATALAVAAIKRWARGGDNVTPKVQAAAAAALVEWEAMKVGKSIGDRLAVFLKAGTIRDNSNEGLSHIADRIQEGGAAAAAAARRAGPAPGGGGKKKRKVRSQAGESRYGKPIGSEIGKTDIERKKKADNLPDAIKKKLPAKYGHQGPHIKRIQGMLDRAGFPLETDGIFGPKTRAAIKEAQKQLGLKVTGIIDPITYVAIMDAKKATGKASRTKRPTRKRHASN